MTPVIAAALVVTGIGLLGASVFIVPSYCGYRLYKRNQQKKRIRHQRKAREELHRRLQELRNLGENLASHHNTALSNFSQPYIKW